MRVKGIEVSGKFAETPHLFLNTHPAELAAGASFDWLDQLRTLAPVQKLTIEIHEAAVTDVEALGRFRARLEELQLGLAFDDFGAGQARLAELAEVRPDYLKFDRRIIKDIDRADAGRKKFVKYLVDAVRDIGVIALAEGVETADECDTCRDLGFDLAQGYFLGRPGPVQDYKDLPAAL
jgi:EAL domain-containing protein (putative c-di-GMP-specific phosphodiesterase class I)